MKKFMFGMMVVSVMVFGADMKVADTPKVAVVPTSPKIAKFNTLIKKAKTIEREEQGAEQIILNVPVSIESLEENGYEIPNGMHKALVCVLDVDEHRAYFLSEAVNYGETTISLKFKGIPPEALAKINTYACGLLLVGDTNGDIIDRLDFAIDPSLLENSKIVIEGNL